MAWTGVSPERFRIPKGEQDVVWFQSSKHGRRGFCRFCGSQMFCRTEPVIVDIALAALHVAIDRRPEAHYYFDSRADWTEVNDDLPKLGGESGMEPL